MWNLQYLLYLLSHVNSENDSPCSGLSHLDPHISFLTHPPASSTSLLHLLHTWLSFLNTSILLLHSKMYQFLIQESQSLQIIPKPTIIPLASSCEFTPPTCPLVSAGKQNYTHSPFPASCFPLPRPRPPCTLIPIPPALSHHHLGSPYDLRSL